MTKAIYINKDNIEEIPSIPRHVAICPICEADIIIEDIDEWELGTGRVTECGFHINCSTLANADNNDWDTWFKNHWSSPYIDWLPIQEKVYQWFDKHFRLDLTNQEK